MLRATRSFLPLFISSLTACVGTETGNPPTGGAASLYMGLHSSEPDTVSSTEGARFQVVDAHMGVLRLSGVSCGGEEAVVIAEATGVDLSAVPLVGGRDGLPRGEYCELRLQLGPAVLGYSRPGAQENLSYALRVQSEASDIAIESDLQVVLPIAPNEGSFALDGTEELVLGLDVARLLGSVLPDIETPDPAGSLDLPGEDRQGYVVDSAGAPELLGRINGALSASFILFIDANGDRELSSGDEILAGPPG